MRSVPKFEYSPATAAFAVMLVVQLTVMLVIEPPVVTGAAQSCVLTLPALTAVAPTCAYVLPRLSTMPKPEPTSSDANATKIVFPTVTVLEDGEITRDVPAVFDWFEPRSWSKTAATG